MYNTGKKSLTLLYVREEILSPEVWGKNSYQITHTPPPPHKSQMVSPWAFFFHFLAAVFVLLFSYMVWKIPSPYTNIYLNVKVVHDNITTVTVDIKGGTREED